MYLLTTGHSVICVFGDNSMHLGLVLSEMGSSDYNAQEAVETGTHSTQSGNSYNSALTTLLN